MDGHSDSYLERRRAAILAGEREIPVSYHELRETAKEQLPRSAYDYAAAGAGVEETMAENRAAFRRYRILPRILRDVSRRELGVELFGNELAAPLVLAPIGGQVRYDDDGVVASARAARDLNVPLAVSTWSSHSIEDIAAANGDGPRFFQLYWPSDWEVAASLAERAEAADYDALVLTIDSRLPKWRHRNLQNEYDSEGDAPNLILESDPVVQRRAEEAGRSVSEFVKHSPSLADDASLTWDDLDELFEWTDLPVVLKGVLSAEDARRAVDRGVDGLIVSNHGGRQIDGEVAALDQLPAIADEVGDEMTLVLDSGVRSGADVFRALALGADAVQFGRPYLFALALAGRQGVSEVVLNCLAELESVMGLSGYPTIGEIDTDAVVRRP